MAERSREGLERLIAEATAQREDLRIRDGLLEERVELLQKELYSRPGSESVGKRQNREAQFNARITSDLRASLDYEALRSGRSVSQVAEAWLLEGRKSSLGDMLWGGAELAPALRAMALAARSITHELGAPSTDLGARDAILLAWRQIASEMLPDPPPTEREVTAARKARTAKISLERAKAAGLEWLDEGVEEHLIYAWRRQNPGELGGRSLEALESMALDLCEGNGAQVDVLMQALADERASDEALERYRSERVDAAHRATEWARIMSIRSEVSERVDQTLSPESVAPDGSVPDPRHP